MLALDYTQECLVGQKRLLMNGYMPIEVLVGLLVVIDILILLKDI